MNKTSTKTETKTVTLQVSVETMTQRFEAGQQFRVLGLFNATMVRLSRKGDNAKLITLLKNVGLGDPEESQSARPSKPITQQRAAADIYSSPHVDDSGPSREIVIATVLAGKDSGTLTMHFTPAEEKEYNRGMAMLADY